MNYVGIHNPKYKHLQKKSLIFCLEFLGTFIKDYYLRSTTMNTHDKDFNPVPLLSAICVAIKDF